MIDLRRATMADGDKLLSWRNDPVTRACFRSTAPIANEDHARWMQSKVLQGFPEHIVLIAESDLGSLGVVRFDAAKDNVMTYETSVTLAPESRGKGLSRQILGAACKAVPQCALTTEVRVWNEVSRKMFEGCGFKEISRDADFIQYRREPQA